MIWRACTLFFAVASCAHAPIQPPGAPAKAAAHEREATLFYSPARFGAGSPLPLPLVKGTIAGHATTLIIDTGAHMPVVASWLAQDAGLAAGPSIQGRDAAGRTVPMHVTDHSGLVIEGWGPADGPAVVGDLPEEFRRVGIGAIVSPQTLATADDVVVLDLTASRMRLVSRTRLRSPGAETGGEFTLRDARVCTYDDSNQRARSLVATVTIDGTPVLLDLDTGANGITVGRATNVGRRLAARPGVSETHGLGAAGGFDAVRANDVAVGMGELEVSVPVDVVVGAASAPCGTAGRLGVDYLRACVLVIGQETLDVSCHLPQISTGEPRCDACLRARCSEPAALCQKVPHRCAAFSTCRKACTSASCIDDCATKSPEGMSLRRCLSEGCSDSCPP